MPRGVYPRKANLGKQKNGKRKCNRDDEESIQEKKQKFEKKLEEHGIEITKDPLDYLTSYDAQLDVAIRIFQNIVLNQQRVYPTTELEHWLIELGVCTFDIPAQWSTSLCVVVFPSDGTGDGVTFYVLAFCRKMRQCLLANEDDQVFKVDADELFHSKHVMINMAEPKTMIPLITGPFPYNLEIVSLDVVLKSKN